jgi:thiol-disulfide isomerase/thioredoxin
VHQRLIEPVSGRVAVFEEVGMNWRAALWRTLICFGPFLFSVGAGCQPQRPVASQEALSSQSEQDRSRASAQVTHAIDTSGGVNSAAGSADSSADAYGVTLGDRETFQHWLDERRGSVVLVDFWATWCPPCVQQFPHTVELSRLHRDAGLAVISVSMNEPRELASVQAFLTKRKARFDHLLTRYGAGADFVEAFELRGDIPFYRLYGRDGRLRYSFSSDPEGIENGEPIDQIDARVLELLAESHEPMGE